MAHLKRDVYDDLLSKATAAGVGEKELRDILEAKGHTIEQSYSEQHPVVGALNAVAEPLQKATEAVLNPVVETIQKGYELGRPDNQILRSIGPWAAIDAVANAGSKIRETGSNIGKSLDRFRASSLGGWLQKNQPGIYGLAEDVGVAGQVLENSPVPASAGEMGIMALTEGALRGVPAIMRKTAVEIPTPATVESGFRRVAKLPGMAGSDVAFDKIAARTAGEEAKVAAAKELGSTEASFERAYGEYKTGLKGTLGSEQPDLQQIARKDLGRNVVEDINAETSRVKKPLMAKYEEAKTRIGKSFLGQSSVGDIRNGFAEIKDDLGSYIKKASDVRVENILEKYIKDTDGEYVSTHDIINDRQALGEIAHNLDDSFKGTPAKRALLKAQEVLDKTLEESLSKMGMQTDVEHLVNTRREVSDFYRKYHSEEINKLRYSHPSAVTKGLFADEETISAAKNAMTPQQWDIARNDYLRKYVRDLTQESDPGRALTKDLENRPGYLESFIPEEELSSLKKVAHSKTTMNLLKEDVRKIEESGIESTAKRIGDEEEAVVLKRKTDNAKLMTRLSRYGGAGGAALYMIASHHPVIGSILATLSVGPEALSYLYLRSPNFRNYLLSSASSVEESGLAQVGSRLTELAMTELRDVPRKEIEDVGSASVPERMMKVATETEKSTGIPAAFGLKQANLESGNMGSGLAKEGNNFFGIKKAGGPDVNPFTKGSVKMTTSEWMQGREGKQKAFFRTYASPEDSYKDWARLMHTPKYSKALDAMRAGKFEMAANELQKAGYATDPNYADKLKRR